MGAIVVYAYAGRGMQIEAREDHCPMAGWAERIRRGRTQLMDFCVSNEKPQYGHSERSGAKSRNLSSPEAQERCLDFARHDRPYHCLCRGQ